MKKLLPLCIALLLMTGCIGVRDLRKTNKELRAEIRQQNSLIKAAWVHLTPVERVKSMLEMEW